MNTPVGAAMALGRLRAWGCAGAIALAAGAAYAGSFAGQFQFDDIPAILDNPTLRHLWPLRVPLEPPSGALTVSGRPVLNLSLALNYAISGTGIWSYHAFNLLIHIGAAWALWGIARRTLGRLGTVRPEAAAWAIAVLWAVHPLTTESVTYVVQRAESLMGLFYLLTLYAFIRAADASARPARAVAWKGFSLAMCLLGCGTKEVIVTAPLVVFIYDRTFVAKGWGAAWRASWRYYLGLAATGVSVVALVAGTGWDRGGTSGFHVGVRWTTYWVSQGEAVARYIGLAIWPHPLAFDYGPPSAPAWLARGLFAALLAALIWTAKGVWRGRPWAFLAGAAFLILAPTSVMPGVLQFAAEHRMYLPLAAVVAAVVVVLPRIRFRGMAPSPRVLAALLTGVGASLGATTAVRNQIYRSDLALWLDTIRRRPQSAVAQANVGQALLLRGRTAEAVPYCLEAIRLDPFKPNPHHNLGLAYEELGRWTEALDQFQMAASLNPKLFYAEYQAGRVLDRLQRPAEAEVALRQALATAPDYAEAHGSLGVALAALGRPNEAVDEFQRSLRLDPDQAGVEFDLGIALDGLGRTAEAVIHFSAAVRLKPDDGQAQLDLGVALARLGRFAEALTALQAAVRLQPDAANTHANFATALDQAGRTREAIEEYHRALRLRPDYAAAHYNLGNALLRVRDLDGARAEFAEAARLKPDFVEARAMLERLDAGPAER